MLTKLASVTEPRGPESSAAEFGVHERRVAPRWAALISTIVIAGLVGGLVGVGVTLGVQRFTTTPSRTNQPNASSCPELGICVARRQIPVDRSSSRNIIAGFTGHSF